MCDVDTRLSTLPLFLRVAGGRRTHHVAASCRTSGCLGLHNHNVTPHRMRTPPPYQTFQYNIYNTPTCYLQASFPSSSRYNNIYHLSQHHQRPFHYAKQTYHNAFPSHHHRHPYHALHPRPKRILCGWLLHHAHKLPCRSRWIRLPRYPSALLPPTSSPA